MKRGRAEGVITVFFSLLSLLFMGVILLLAESVRYQGARAQTVHITEMANYSVFGEYEKKLLKDFELFGVDASYGSGDFSIDRVGDRMRGYLEKNAEPTKKGLSAFCFDPWNVGLKESEIEAYTLLSDGSGEQVYQQAVSYMRKTAAAGLGWKLLSWYRFSKSEEEKQRKYAQEKLSADRELEEVERQEEAKKQELMRQSETGDGQLTVPEQPPAELPKIENPIPAIRKLWRKSIFEIVCPDAQISRSKVGRSDLPSKRRIKKGTLKTKRKYSGLLNNLLFSEYLMDHFGCFGEKERGGKLRYELEYILSGKKNDDKNLRAVIYQLILFRECSNYLYCAGDARMNAEAGSFAELLTGWIGLPALTAMMKHALLLAWAYGESLLDVRALMNGSRVALLKSPETWKLSLDKLASINELLDANAGRQKEGMSYRGYLRLLLYMQWISKQKARGMDLIELRVRSGEGLSNFHLDYCVTGLKSRTSWDIPPAFSGAAGIFGVGAAGQAANTVSGGFAYLH